MMCCTWLLVAALLPYREQVGVFVKRIPLSKWCRATEAAKPLVGTRPKVEPNIRVR